MNEPVFHIVLVIVAYALAGFVKGVIGMGLPTVALGVLAVVMTPAQAAAILIAPSFATNLWQMLAGPHLPALLRRLGGMLAALAVGAWIGAGTLAGADARQVAFWLGAVLIAYAVLGLSHVKLTVRRDQEIWLAPLTGIATGYVMACTGIFVIPALPYLQAIGMEKDELVQALGLHFIVSTFVLAAVLWHGGVFAPAVLTLSLFAIVPALIGMYAGQRVRAKVSIGTFRICLFAGLLLLGLHLVWRNLL